MAIIFRDGFDTYNGVSSTSVGVASKWSISVAGTLVAGRFGGQALQFTGGNTNSMTTSVFSAVSSLTLECGLKITTGSTGSPIFFREGSTNHVDLVFSSDGSITARRNTTTLGTSATGVYTPGVWFSLQVELVISDTVGRVTVVIDGAVVLNLTGQDTQNGGTGVVDRLFFTGASSAPTAAWDDMIVLDTATRLTNPVRIETLVPDTDGGTLNWVPSSGTAHYAVVDELPVSATDYLSAAFVGDVDELALSALTGTPISIEEVVVVGYASKTDTATRTMNFEVESGATTSTGSAYTLGTSGLRYERPLATDPNTAVAWTASGVNALLVRPKVAS